MCNRSVKFDSRESGINLFGCLNRTNLGNCEFMQGSDSNAQSQFWQYVTLYFFCFYCTNFTILQSYTALIVTDGKFDGQTVFHKRNFILEMFIICVWQPVHRNKLLICAFATLHLPHENIFPFKQTDPHSFFHLASHICHVPL